MELSDHCRYDLIEIKPKLTIDNTRDSRDLNIVARSILSVSKRLYSCAIRNARRAMESSIEGNESKTNLRLYLSVGYFGLGYLTEAAVEYLIGER